MDTIQLQFGKGINNKARAESMPEGFARSAINVDVDNAGNVRNRPGFTQLYAGNCHSIWGRYFVEGGDLKYLNTDNTATTIKSGVGDEPLSYTSIASRIYFSNGVNSGSIVDGKYQAWGVARPPFQPTASARSSGDMHEGEYRTAITWLRNGEESGTGAAVKTTVFAGGGLLLTDFPTPPSDITAVAVYVSSANGKDLYLQGEYPADISEVSISKHISTIPLITQFSNKPSAGSIVQGHYGRVYMASGNFVYYSNPQNYGLFMPNNYWRFSSKVTLMISIPGVMYIGTADKIYRISNIDADGFAANTVIKEYGAPIQLNNVDDPDNEVVYFRSNKGDCIASGEGITEITASNLAMDAYLTADLTLIESDGQKRLIGISQGINKVSDLKSAI